MRDEHIRERLWSPDADRVASSRVRAYQEWLAGEHAVPIGSYEELQRWSTQYLDLFWESVWRRFDVVGERGDGPVYAGDSIDGIRWFPGATVNYAENILRHADLRPDEEAVVGVHESRTRTALTWAELRGQVGALAEALKERGVERGDRVCAVLPNVPETIVALLATAAVGAVWSVVNPDFGVAGIRERFAQIEPKVLITLDGYEFNGKYRDMLPTVGDLVGQLPTVEHHILVDTAPERGDQMPDLGIGSSRLSQLVAVPKAPVFERVEFSHELWVLYSSGTTGSPKGIVHSHGGIVLEALKANALQYDLGPDDRVCFAAATSWVMWNIMVNAMSVGATVVAYDGSPTHGIATKILEVAAAEKVTLVGAGAAVYTLMERSGVAPDVMYDLSALRSVFSSGSPLPESTWRWLYERVKADMHLGSDSGGTDICTGIIGSNPLDDVWLNELQGAYLGVDADIVDPAGRSVTGEVGELVVRQAMPSMPVRFWNDPDRSRLQEAYFEEMPGLWRQGDWATKVPDGGYVIHGRSDSTINRGGIRMGSADITKVVDALDGISASMVIGAELRDGDYYMPLFVVPEPGRDLDAGLRELITRTIREEVSPRYVPDEIIEAPAVPRTRTGKLMEVPVKRVFQGADPAKVNLAAAEDQDVVQWYLRQGVEYSRRHR